MISLNKLLKQPLANVVEYLLRQDYYSLINLDEETQDSAVLGYEHTSADDTDPTITGEVEIWLDQHDKLRCIVSLCKPPVVNGDYDIYTTNTDATFPYDLLPYRQLDDKHAPYVILPGQDPLEYAVSIVHGVELLDKQLFGRHRRP